MLTLKSMSWENCFSYGKDNYIEFNKEPLTQLVGINGSGKTSISLMIQEALYGKNNKNIKKQDIANNKSGEKGYRINLKFDKDGDEYSVLLDRKANLKFKLYKNGEDISSHTSLNTYKTLADIIGVADFKVFCQLIYQHSTDSLDFLTATDTNRKKFLISLLQLDRYLELHEHFKEKVRVINSEITGLLGSVGTIESWIEKHKDMDFLKQELLEIEHLPERHAVRADQLVKDIANINSINKKIATNNEYKSALNKLNDKYYMGSAPPNPHPGLIELRAQVRILEHDYAAYQSKISKLNTAVGECPECLQTVDETTKEEMIQEEIERRDKVKAKVSKFWDQIPKVEITEIEIKRYKKEKTEFERLSQLIDYNLPGQTLDLNEMQEELSEVRSHILTVQNRIKSNQTKNLQISAHNSKIDVVKNQLAEMKEELKERNIDLMDKENRADILELLKKTFSTNGLVAYKIESSIKELERTINEYLAELTYFQMYFILDGEKLNINIRDDLGNSTSISNLSSGEQARVNISCILAIRSILSSLTSTRINILMLDEVVNTLDALGREQLTNILLRENLNSFIVSHEWEHPLVPRIYIVKEHNISRIEND